MKLTKGDFSLFSFSSQKVMLFESGINIISKHINSRYESRIYLLYDFYVETLINRETKEIETINLAISTPPGHYFD